MSKPNPIDQLVRVAGTQSTESPTCRVLVGGVVVTPEPIHWFVAFALSGALRKALAGWMPRPTKEQQRKAITEADFVDPEHGASVKWVAAYNRALGIEEIGGEQAERDADRSEAPDRRGEQRTHPNDPVGTASPAAPIRCKNCGRFKHRHACDTTGKTMFEPEE